MTHVAILLAALAVTCPERLAGGPSIDLPQAAGKPLARHQTWTGDDWVWIPADVCPICGHQDRPIPIDAPDVPRVLCPNCGAMVREGDWDRFDLLVAPLRRRPITPD